MNRWGEGGDFMLIHTTGIYTLAWEGKMDPKGNDSIARDMKSTGLSHS